MQVFIWAVLVKTHWIHSWLGEIEILDPTVPRLPSTSQGTLDVKVSVITLAGIVLGFSWAGAGRGGKQELAEMHH